MSDIQSPCRNVCALDADTQICTGCGRTIEEIATWSALTPAQRADVMRRLSERQVMTSDAE